MPILLLLLWTLLTSTPLRQWRIDNNYTLEEISDLTGVSISQLNRGERGERGFAPATKVRIARCLGVRVRDLFPVEELTEDAV